MTFHGSAYEVAAISLCSRLPVCSPPRSFLPLQVSSQGSRGFYIRAERASLPSHASDILSARLQAIGGTRTFTSQDSQPCRLLTNDADVSTTSPMLPIIASEGRRISWLHRFAFATACRVACPPGGSDRGSPQPTGTFTSELSVGSVALPAVRYNYGGD